MPPQLNSPTMEHSSEEVSWATSDFDSSWDTDFSFSFEQAQVDRGRESTRRASSKSRRRKSDDGHTKQHHSQQQQHHSQHHFIPPQYSNFSPDMRKSRKQSPQRQRQSLSQQLENRYNSAASLDQDYILPDLEPPTRHDYSMAMLHSTESPPLRHARSLSPQSSSNSLDSSSMVSRERLNLFPSPMKSPVLHKSESIELQAKRAARSKPISLKEVKAMQEQAAASLDNKHGGSPSSKSTESLLMFGDVSNDSSSVMTGMSQQDLIIRTYEERKRQNSSKREKKYKPKRKDRVRILNLPGSLKGSNSSNTAAGNSPVKKHKYQKGVPEDENVKSVEQAPNANSNKSKNLLSRYSVSKKRGPAASSTPGEGERPVRHHNTSHDSCMGGGLKNWDRISSGMESVYSASQFGDELSTRSDDLAQAAENWIKSNEETHAAQFTSAIDVDEVDVYGREDLVDFAAGFDQNSTSTNGSEDDERPTAVEDGAFPSLRDTLVPFGPTQLSFEEEFDVAGKSTEDAQWHDVHSGPSDWFLESSQHALNQEAQARSIGITAWDSSDKTSEESPVSVMGLDGSFDPRTHQSSSAAIPKARNRRLLPPSDADRRTRQRPASILRQGRHSGTKEVEEKIQSVKSARVKFHENVIRAHQDSFSSQMAVIDDGTQESASSYQSSEFDASLSIEDSRNNTAADPIPPQDIALLLERDASNLSAIPESEHSIQTEPSESKPTDSVSEASDFHDAPDNDKEWALDEHEHASFGDFGQMEPQVVRFIAYLLSPCFHSLIMLLLYCLGAGSAATAANGRGRRGGGAILY